MEANENGQLSMDLPRYDGPLYTLFLEKLPKHQKDGKLNFHKLAKDLGLVRQTIYLMCWNNFIDAAHVKKLIALPGSTLVESDFLPFIFKG